MTSYTNFNNEFLFFSWCFSGTSSSSFLFTILLSSERNIPLAYYSNSNPSLFVFFFTLLNLITSRDFFSLSDCRDGTGKSRATAQINPNLRTSNPFKFSHIDTVVVVLVVFFSYPLLWKSAWLSKIWVSTPLFCSYGWSSIFYPFERTE